MKTILVFLFMLIIIIPGFTVAQGEIFSTNSINNSNPCLNISVPNYHYTFQTRVYPTQRTFLNVNERMTSDLFVANFNYPVVNNSGVDRPQAIARPPLQFGKITKQVLTGGAGALLGALIATPFYNERDFNPSWIPPQLVAGICLGTSVCVYFGGITENESSSFYNTMLGSLGGAMFGMLLTRSDHEPFYLVLVPPITATITFNLSRNYKSYAIDLGGYRFID